MPAGTLHWSQDFNTKLQGVNSPFIIVLSYRYPGGVQAGGTPYSGTSRTAYIPGTEEGVECLGLLLLAFQRKLTFIVGTSLTTGKKNTVVWAGIHHKTNVSGGVSHFGWPDETYFARVKGELSDRGITVGDI